MRELYDIKDRLLDELMTYAERDLTAGSLTMIDTLAHAIKNLDKIIVMSDYDRDSYARGRGRYIRKHSMEGSPSDGVSSELQELLRNAPDDMTHQKIKSIIAKMGA